MVKEKKTAGTFSRLKEKEKGLRRNIIINAAEKLFASKPFHKVSVRDIAKEAGISASAIYRYFPDQKSLFLESFSRGTIALKKEIDILLADGREATIEVLTDRFIEYFTEKDQYFRMMINFFLEGPVDAEMFEKLSDIERALLDQFDVIFGKMGIDKDTRIYSHTLFAALTGILAIFRSSPDKSYAQILHHRKRIAGVLSTLFKTALDRR